MQTTMHSFIKAVESPSMTNTQQLVSLSPLEDVWKNSATIDIGNGTVEVLDGLDVFVWIDRWITPLWYVLGIPGNVLAYIVWIQRRMRQSSGCYLAALALDECIFLILQMVFELQFKWSIQLVEYPVLCELFPLLFLTSQYLSPLLVLGFTVERYISVCHPFQREIFCTTTRAVKVIASALILTLVVNSVQGYFWQYDLETHTCKLRTEVTQSGSLSLWSIWTWITEMLVFGAVPLSILFLNLLVILETRRLTSIEKRLIHQQHNSFRSSPGGGSAGKDSGGSSASSATTVMLLAVSFYLIATTLPVTVLYVLYLSFAEGDPALSNVERASDPQWQRHYTYVNVKIVVEEIGMSHYALNFFIYMFTGKIFRRELCRLARRVFKLKGESRQYVTWFTKDDTSLSMVRAEKKEIKLTNHINGNGCLV